MAKQKFGLKFVFTINSWFWMKVFRLPIQTSAIFIDILTAFLCVCFVGLFGYVILILRIPSVSVKHNHHRQFFNRSVITKQVNPHQIVSNEWSANHINRNIIYRKHHAILPPKIVLLGGGRGRGLLNKKRHFYDINHEDYKHKVDRYINSRKQYINNFHNTSITINNQVCGFKNDNQSVDLLVLIFSSGDNHQNRKVIRDTWLTHAKRNTENVRYLFLLGESSPEINRNISMENRIYKDILQGSFLDTYKNLTMKTMMGLKWTVDNCHHAHYVFKTDDDVWVNIPALLKHLKTFREETFTVGGKCQIGSPHRDPSSKYYVSNENYLLNVYPPFCTGTGYVTTPRIAFQLVNISKYVPYLHLEDIYVALCLVKLGKKVISIPGFYNSHNINKVTGCVLKTSHVLMMHEFSPTELLHIWKTGSNCTNRSYTGLGQIELKNRGHRGHIQRGHIPRGNIPMGNIPRRMSHRSFRGRPQIPKRLPNYRRQYSKK